MQTWREKENVQNYYLHLIIAVENGRYSLINCGDLDTVGMLDNIVSAIQNHLDNHEGFLVFDDVRAMETAQTAIESYVTGQNQNGGTVLDVCVFYPLLTSFYTAVSCAVDNDFYGLVATVDSIISTSAVTAYFKGVSSTQNSYAYNVYIPIDAWKTLGTAGIFTVDSTNRIGIYAPGIYSVTANIYTLTTSGNSIMLNVFTPEFDNAAYPLTTSNFKINSAGFPGGQTNCGLNHVTMTLYVQSSALVYFAPAMNGSTDTLIQEIDVASGGNSVDIQITKLS